MRTIDDKLLKNNLKKGWTIEDFCRHCQMSVEEFMSQLERNFSKKFYDCVLRELKRNEKARKRNEKSKSTGLQQKQIEIFKPAEKAEISTLDELLDKEEELKSRLITMEKNCKTLIEKRNVCGGKLSEEKLFFERIYQQILSRGKAVENLMKEIEELDKELTAEKTLKAELDRELKNVQNQIKVLREVSIHCFEDGRVEMEDVETLDWSQKFHDLTSESEDESISKDSRFMQVRELAEDLSVKQVKQLAKILTLIEMLEQQGQKFILEFDKESHVAALLELVDFKVVH